MNFPSIQSFYQKEVTPKTHGPSKLLIQAQDAGFTSTEVQAALRPLTQPWNPTGTYEPVAIAELEPGPRQKVRITGRLVNFSPSSEDREPKWGSVPQGYHLLVVKDDTGVVAIRLLATGIDHEYLQLGRLVTVWTAFVAEYSANYSTRIPLVSAIIPVHPSQSSASCIKFHKDTDSPKDINLCRLPLGYTISSQSSTIPDLMSLKSYLTSGHEGVPGAKILVCVASIGPRKTVKSPKRQVPLDLIEIGVFDETARSVLKLWDDKAQSARLWIPNKTILLITNPHRSLPDKKKTSSQELSIGITSIIDVDPVFPDANWLRQMAASRTKKESVYIPFPTNMWNSEEAEAAMNGPVRALFTIAEVDEFARNEADEAFTGKLNLLIYDGQIMKNWRRQMLCCFECCGVPLYANKPHATCKNCGSECDLFLNPRIIGLMMDETGCIETGKLIWSERAWTELFFGTDNVNSSTEPSSVNTTSDETKNSTTVQGEPNQHDHVDDKFWKKFTDLEYHSLREVEEQMQFQRVTLTFGWSSEVGRLCILGVEW
ncbi:hypothetical protein B0T17DRAFT_592697 [Bombardia bombarda]|uniref:Uncharacterized protein n=1 Tax=Bombardia bombarda TaxID=252184 RepID=A0AA39WIK8_9PEZI|nr:hypothetical protein B0T17DRAFT_592697 [Bombardia bombarda]